MRHSSIGRGLGMRKLKNLLGLLTSPRAPSTEELELERARLDAERNGVLNHAYGFISRGNRAGGIRHIESYLESESSHPVEAVWFFNAMTEWEHPDAALAFGRELIGRLLREGFPTEARKILLRCKALDERFLPRPEDQIPLAAESPEVTRP